VTDKEVLLGGDERSPKMTDKEVLPEGAVRSSKNDPITDKVVLPRVAAQPASSNSATNNALSSVKIDKNQSGGVIAIDFDDLIVGIEFEELVQAAPDFHQNERADIPKEITAPKIPFDWDELLLFRSSDPSIWNQSVNEGSQHCAILLSEVPGNIAYLRLRRLDTGEGVVIAIQGSGGLNQDGGDLMVGFNGSNEEFYGARHLGIYSEESPQQVEIRFAYGGWGFGHRLNNETAQACAWAGQEINSDTVIEITVFSRFPGLTDNDQLIEPS